MFSDTLSQSELSCLDPALAPETRSGGLETLLSESQHDETHNEGNGEP